MVTGVRYERSGAVSTITMDDGKVNALSTDMLQELNAALDQAEVDDAIVVLTGRDGIFSAGFDLAVLAGDGGAALVARLLETAPARLNPGGRVLLELDPSIVLAALEVADRNFAGRRVHQDLAGHERVLEAWS